MTGNTSIADAMTLVSIQPEVAAYTTTVTPPLRDRSEPLWAARHPQLMSGRSASKLITATVQIPGSRGTRI